MNPIVQPFLTGDRKRDANNFGPRIGFNWATRSGGLQRARRLRHLLRPRHAGDQVARARPRRPRAADRSAGRQRVLPRSGDRARCRRSRRRSRIRSPGSSCPAPAPPASTSSTTRMQNPTVQQFNLGVAARCLGGVAVLRVDGVHNLRHALHHRPAHRRGLQSGGGRPRPRGEPRVERRTRSTTRCCVSFERRFTRRRFGSALAYTLVAARNYANDDQIPFGERPDRSERSCSASTARRRTSSAIG